MEVDLRGIGDPDDCENMKEVASKVGTQVICDDDDAKEIERAGAYDFSENEECDNIKTVASKVGVQVVCDDDE